MHLLQSLAKLFRNSRSRRVFSGALIAGIGSACLVLALPALQAAAWEDPETVIATRSTSTIAKSGSVRRAKSPIVANLVGARWNGSANELLVRSRSTAGRWSAWAPLSYEPNEGPDTDSREGKAAVRTRKTAKKVAALPVWIGSTQEVQFKVAVAGTTAKNVEVVYINTTGTATKSARVGTAVRSALRSIVGHPKTATASPATPNFITRPQWGADESIRKNTYEYSAPLKAGVLHHTVNANNYTRKQARALVRGIYVYHVKGNGWSDIGYNFLVDRYGQVFEGRHGGVTKNIMGAHAGGFNTSTTGVALLGTHDRVGMTTRQRASVVRLLSWRLDLGHVRATGKSTLTSAGNSKFSEGKRIRARNLSGHRDFYYTGCPGGIAYRTINSLRTQIWLSGGPKFAYPIATYGRASDGTVNALTIRAIGNQSMTYTASLTRTTDGAPVATLVGSGMNAALTWDGTSLVGPVKPWEITWKLDAAANSVGATPYQTVLMQVPPQVHVDQFSVTPSLVSPNSDGLNDTIKYHLRLNTDSKVDLTIVEAANHANVIRQIYTNQRFTKGSRTYTASATTDGVTPLPDGDYALHIVAHDEVGRPDSEAWTDFSADSALSMAEIPLWLSPNGDGRFDTLPLNVGVVGPLATQVLILQSNATVRTLLDDPVANGAQVFTFDGLNTGAVRLSNGTYQVSAQAATTHSLDLRRSFVIDNTPPWGRAIRLRNGKLRVWFSEPVTVYGSVRVNGQVVVRHNGFLRRWATSSRFPGSRKLVLQDRAGNRRTLRVTPPA